MRARVVDMVGNPGRAATSRPKADLEEAVNRTELIEAISGHTGLTRQQSESALEAVVYEITAGVRSGEPVRITGFGSFKLRQRAARRGRNPQTGAAVKVKASKGIGFTPGVRLKADLNARGAPAKPGGAAKSVAAVKPAVKAPAKAVAKASTSKATATKAPAKAAVKATPAKKVASKTTAKSAPVKVSAAKRTVPVTKAAAKKATSRAR